MKSEFRSQTWIQETRKNSENNSMNTEAKWKKMYKVTKRNTSILSNARLLMRTPYFRK